MAFIIRAVNACAEPYAILYGFMSGAALPGKYPEIFAKAFSDVGAARLVFLEDEGEDAGHIVSYLDPCSTCGDVIRTKR